MIHNYFKCWNFKDFVTWLKLVEEHKTNSAKAESEAEEYCVDI